MTRTLLVYWFELIQTRRAVDRWRGIYVTIVGIQVGTVVLYELGMLANGIAAVAGSATSLAGPLLSFLVSLHIIRHRRASKALDVASVALTYVVTCLSFAVLYIIIADKDAAAFNPPPNQQKPFGLGTALYFSIVTITTTGYGDISPASSLARLASCWEIITGLLYQVFVFSLVAALIATPPDTNGHGV